MIVIPCNKKCHRRSINRDYGGTSNSVQYVLLTKIAPGKGKTKISFRLALSDNQLNIMQKTDQIAVSRVY